MVWPCIWYRCTVPRMESNTNLHIWGKERKKKKRATWLWRDFFFRSYTPLAKFLLPGALDLCSLLKFVVWFFLPRAVWAIIPAPTSPQYVHTYTKGYSESASVKAICEGYFIGVLTLGIYRQQAKSGCFFDRRCSWITMYEWILNALSARYCSSVSDARPSVNGPGNTSKYTLGLEGWSSQPYFYSLDQLAEFW